MLKNYSEIFKERGHAYDAAMHFEPDARRAEFTTLFGTAPLQAGESLFDIPSGGGYLRWFVPDSVQLSQYDFSEGFSDEEDVHWLDASSDNWALEQADRVVSLAGLHHTSNPIATVGRLLNHVRPGGLLHVADVAAGSGPAKFLNGFVNDYNPFGHEGIFLPASREAWPATWDIRRFDLCTVPWQFSNVDAMGEFCCLLFGVPMNHKAALIEALSNDVGFTVAESGQCAVAWALLYVDIAAM